MVQIPEQSQSTAYLPFAVLLKAKTQGDGERGADHGDDDDAVIVLNIGSHLAVHFVLNFPLHTGVAAAKERTADFDTIDGRHHQSSGPVGTQHPVAFQLPGDLATERKHRLGRLSLERVADGIVADRSDAFAQRSGATLSLHLQKTGNLHGGTEEDRVEHLLPRMLRKLPPLGQGVHQIRKAKHLIEISLESVSDQAEGSSFFSLRNRFRLTLQMVAAAASKRWRISIFARTFSANSAGMLRAFGLPSIKTEIWYWECRRLPSAQ